MAQRRRQRLTVAGFWPLGRWFGRRGKAVPEGAGPEASASPSPSRAASQKATALATSLPDAAAPAPAEHSAQPAPTDANIEPILITAVPQMSDSAFQVLPMVLKEAEAAQTAFGGGSQAKLVLNIGVEELDQSLRGRTAWYFAGHGDALLQGEAVLAFTGPDGSAQAVSVDALVAIIRPHVISGRLRLLVLTGCRTLALATALHERAYVPYVVCWSTSVHDQAASVFGVAFAEATEAESPAESATLAFEAACKAVCKVTERGFLDTAHACAVQRFELVDPMDQSLVHPVFPLTHHSGRLRRFAPAAGRGRLAAGVPKLLLPDESKLYGVPNLPKHLLRRPEHTMLREALVAGKRGAGTLVGIVGGGRAAGAPSGASSLAGEADEDMTGSYAGGAVSGIAGTAGLGKTTTAIWLARDVLVRTAFRDGTYWLEFGKARSALDNLTRLGRMLGVDAAELAARQRVGAADVCDALVERLAGKHCLLVLDDVWDEAQPAPFQRLASDGVTVLMTTRKVACVESFGSLLLPLSLAPMDDGDAIRLLVASAGRSLEELGADALSPLVKMCSGLPAMLRSVGRMCSSRSPEAVLDFFRTHRLAHRLPKAMARADGYQIEAAKGNLFLAYEGQIDALAEEDDCLANRCTRLAVLPEDTPVPIRPMLMALWAVDEAEAREVVERLSGEHLVEMRALRPPERTGASAAHAAAHALAAKADAANGDAIELIDPVRDYLRCRGKSALPEWHAELLCTLDAIHPPLTTIDHQGDQYWRGSNFAWHLGCCGHLLRAGSLGSVTSLVLWGTKLDDEAVGGLACALRNGALASLATLVLDHNDIADAGLVALSGALSAGGGAALAHINFAYNRVADAGVRALASAVRAGALRGLATLDLSSNRITDDGALALAGALQAASEGGGAKLQLTELLLGDNLVGNAAARKVAGICGHGAIPSLLHLSFGESFRDVHGPLTV